MILLTQGGEKVLPSTSNDASSGWQTTQRIRIDEAFPLPSSTSGAKVSDHSSSQSRAWRRLNCILSERLSYDASIRKDAASVPLCDRAANEKVMVETEPEVNDVVSQLLVTDVADADKHAPTQVYGITAAGSFTGAARVRAPGLPPVRREGEALPLNDTLRSCSCDDAPPVFFTVTAIVATLLPRLGRDTAVQLNDN